MLYKQQSKDISRLTDLFSKVTAECTKVTEAMDESQEDLLLQTGQQKNITDAFVEGSDCQLSRHAAALKVGR